MMGMFGWSYPAGCSGPPDEVYDEEACCTCGCKLPIDPKSESWDDHGFCSLTCAAKFDDAMTLSGQCAIDMAQLSGKFGGPGFEGDLIREWRQAATDNAPIMLYRRHADADVPGASHKSWSWRLMSGGQCRSQRLTAK